MRENGREEGGFGINLDRVATHQLVASDENVKR